MVMAAQQSLPLSASLFGVEPECRDPPRPNDRLLSLLPASYRTASDDVAAAGRHVHACIAKEQIWTSGQLFLKPIARFLFEPGFFCCRPGSGCAAGSECDQPTLRRRAIGFLFSYVALISHKSDIPVAKDNHLLPPDVTWLEPGRAYTRL